jgi:hypothetical protein
MFGIMIACGFFVRGSLGSRLCRLAIISLRCCNAGGRSGRMGLMLPEA